MSVMQDRIAKGKGKGKRGYGLKLPTFRVQGLGFIGFSV